MIEEVAKTRNATLKKTSSGFELKINARTKANKKFISQFGNRLTWKTDGERGARVVYEIVK
jgi:hypothetical protein